MVVFDSGYCYARAMYSFDFSYQWEEDDFMVRFFYRDLSQLWRKGSTIFLAFFWCSGLVCGILTFFSAGDSLVSLMRSTITGSVSIVSLFCVTLLPFLISAFAVFISEPRLLLLVSFGKALLFSLVSLAIMQAFGSAGWFVRWLLLLSDSASLPVLYWFWTRYIAGNRQFSCLEICGLCSMMLLIGSFDYCIVSPFLACLLVN